MDKKHSIAEKTIFVYNGTPYNTLKEAIARKEIDDNYHTIINHNNELIKNDPRKYVGVIHSNKTFGIVTKTKHTSNNMNIDWNCCLQDRYVSSYTKKLTILSNKELLECILLYDGEVEGKTFEQFMEAIYQCCEEHPEYYPKIIKHLSTLNCSRGYSY